MALFFGKWSVAGVPKKGWSCTDDEDLGPDEREVCQMCEKEEIRYVHIMTHPDYSGALRSGCVCAGKMSEDYVGARQRQADMERRGRRRDRFPTHKNWQQSRKGHPTIRHQGYRITIIRRGAGFKAAIALDTTSPDVDQVYYSRARPSVSEAKLAAFDLIAAANKRKRSHGH